jgi:hypothetical protein
MGKCLFDSCKQNLIKILFEVYCFTFFLGDSRKFACLSKSIKRIPKSFLSEKDTQLARNIIDFHAAISKGNDTNLFELAGGDL